jgi:hypothetical protein
MENTVDVNRVWLGEQVKEHSPVADPKTPASHWWLQCFHISRFGY